MKEIELWDAQKALAKVVTEKSLKELAAKHSDLVVVRSRADLSLAMSALSEFRSTRTTITKTGKAVRDDANAFCRSVIAEEKRLIGIIQPEENRIQELRKAYEDEQERIKREAEEKERQRVAGHRERLSKFISAPARTTGLSSAEIEEQLAKINAVAIDETWEEFRDEAETEKAAAIAILSEMIDRARVVERREAEEKERRRQEAEALARQKAEQENAAAELRRRQEAIEKTEAELKDMIELRAVKSEEVRQAKEIDPHLKLIREWALRHKISNEALAELLDILKTPSWRGQ